MRAQSPSTPLKVKEKDNSNLFIKVYRPDGSQNNIPPIDRSNTGLSGSTVGKPRLAVKL